jgi:hypothetical protein
MSLSVRLPFVHLKIDLFTPFAVVSRPYDEHRVLHWIGKKRITPLTIVLSFDQ